jgi:hypothetical protein
VFLGFTIVATADIRFDRAYMFIEPAFRKFNKSLIHYLN